jgi:hypothetical protein
MAPTKKKSIFAALLVQLEVLQRVAASLPESLPLAQKNAKLYQRISTGSTTLFSDDEDIQPFAVWNNVIEVAIFENDLPDKSNHDRYFTRGEFGLSCIVDYTRRVLKDAADVLTEQDIKFMKSRIGDLIEEGVQRFVELSSLHATPPDNVLYLQRWEGPRQRCQSQKNPDHFSHLKRSLVLLATAHQSRHSSQRLGQTTSANVLESAANGSPSRLSFLPPSPDFKPCRSCEQLQLFSLTGASFALSHHSLEPRHGQIPAQPSRQIDC